MYLSLSFIVFKFRMINFVLTSAQSFVFASVGKCVYSAHTSRTKLIISYIPVGAVTANYVLLCCLACRMF